MIAGDAANETGEQLMRQVIVIVVAAFFYYSGLVKFARWWRRRSGRCLVIVNYHRASGGDLRRHLLYLRRHYRMVHLEEALEELYAPPGTRAQGYDRRTPLVLTFDDGYYDCYTHGFALARELQIPMTVFLIPGYVENGHYFWWLEAERMVQHAQTDRVTIDGHTYQLKDAEERASLIQTIDARLRHATSVEEREDFLASIREMLAVSLPVVTGSESLRPLTWSEIHEMDESGWVSFGGHTMNHPILAYLSCPEEVRREVADCRAVMAQRLNHPVRVFAYPVGKPEHIGELAPQVVREAGYNWAVTTTKGFATAQDDPYQLRRVLIDVTRPWLLMAAETSGVWHFFSPLWKRKASSDGELVNGR